VYIYRVNPFRPRRPLQGHPLRWTEQARLLAPRRGTVAHLGNRGFVCCDHGRSIFSVVGVVFTFTRGIYRSRRGS